RYGVSVSALQSSNNLSSTTIRADKNLMIPLSASRASQMADATNSTKREPRERKSAENRRVVHHVRRGDTLWSIAKKYKVQVNNLLSWNNLSKNQILKLDQAVMVMTN
ncbi:MAG: LysM peptidoglycan-binding domain-containing protein, partial [Arenicella sp.]|nr:LysM peptidoglycan-binding domain-containing protein [Arenicella sp.]